MYEKIIAAIVRQTQERIKEIDKSYSSITTYQMRYSEGRAKLEPGVRQHCNRSEEKMEWQPIETMPKDGGSYLVADAVRGNVAPYIRGVIHNNTGTRWDWQYGEAITHWMPLPAPPQSA